MTLILAAIGRESIWIAADRRLSVGLKAVDDNAVKITEVSRSDGLALLGYAGLGRTPGNTEPSQWMCNVLRDRNWPLVQSLGCIAGAIGRQIPKYLFRVPGLSHWAHVVVAPAILKGEPTIFSLELDLHPTERLHRVRFQRWETQWKRPATFGVAGSGTPYVMRQQLRVKNLVRLIRKHEAGRISAQGIALQFAKLNLEVSAKDQSVGPNCIVAWRYRREGSFKGGGAHQFFEGTKPAGGPGFPSNLNGTDMSAVMNVMWPFVQEVFADMKAGVQSGLDRFTVKINEQLRKLPSEPDEKL
jgi:hypothetical protein